mgnify:FL=1
MPHARAKPILRKARPVRAEATQVATKVKPLRAGAPTRHRAMKVLIAVDGSIYTRRMLDFLIRNFGVNVEPPEFTVLHAVTKVSAHALAVLDRSVVKHYYRDEAATVFRPIHRRFDKLGIKADFTYRVGNPAEVIATTAESGDFDVVIMGTQGTNPLKRLVMGSVATRVMAQCKVPVLLVP